MTISIDRAQLERFAAAPLTGLRIGAVVRNSTASQVDNWSSVEQEQALAGRVEALGGVVVPFDEQSTSGRDLSKRKVMLEVLKQVDRRELQGIAFYDVKRLTRNEFGIDGGVIAKRLIAARAILVTAGRVYRLWQEDDLLDFQLQCFISGIDIRNIRRTFWRGLMARAKNEIFFLRTPIGYTTAEVETGRNGPDRHPKTKRVPRKDPAQAELMDAISDAFEDCASLGEAARRLNDAGHRYTIPSGPQSGQPGTWTANKLWKLLRRPIYTGDFDFGYTVDRRNVVWEDHRADSMQHHDPDLAYWRRAQVIRWSEKFGAGAAPRIRARRHLHPLLGALACSTCGRTMISAGATPDGHRRYWCPMTHDRTKCSYPQTIMERVALRELRAVLLSLLPAGLRLAEEARRQLTQNGRADELRDELAILEEQHREQRATLAKFPVIPDAVVEHLLELEQRMRKLRDDVEVEEAKSLGSSQIQRLCELLASEPEHYFDQLTPEQQGRVYRLMVKDVQIEGTGHGRGRRWRIKAYTPLIGQESVVNDPTCSGTG
jgi:hypothetical protein